MIMNGLMALSRKIKIPGESGHKARVQFLRVLFKRHLYFDLMSGTLDEIDPDSMDICLSFDDSQQVIMEFVQTVREENLEETVKAYLGDKWISWTLVGLAPRQLMLF
jgi:hypothetical protein